MNDFLRDDKFQRTVRDGALAGGFYGKFAVEGRYVFIDKGALATRLQREFAVDTMAQGRQGRAVCIEEKIVRWPGYEYTAYFLETESNTKPGWEKPGWMIYGQADLLLYCLVQPLILVWHCLDFRALQAWFLPIAETFPRSVKRDTINQTAGRIVPFEAVPDSVKVTRGQVWPDLDDPKMAEIFCRQTVPA